MSTPALVVVLPHATATGSTEVILGLLRSSAQDLGLPLEIVLQSGGPRSAELAALGRPHQFGVVPAMVLVNTCLAADHLLGVAQGVPKAVYVHEAGAVIARLPEPAAAGLRLADLVLCVSDAIRDDLVHAGIEPSRIRVLPPLVSPAPAADQADAIEVRSSLGMGAGDRLVLGCGEASERKGADLFVQLAFQFADDPSVRFLWIGRRLRSIARLLDHDVEAAGLVDRLQWVDHVPDPGPYLAAADVLAMTSRADPQPLVPIEAAQQGTPTVGFHVGGVAELGAAGAAVTVPYPDVHALADAVTSVTDGSGLASQLVAAAIERRDARQSPDRVVPEFIAAIERGIGLGRHRST